VSKSKKKAEAALPTEHDPLWQEHALGLGWPTPEIATLESILRLPSPDEHRVVRVTSRVITRLTIGTSTVKGIGVNGPSESTIPYQKYSDWPRNLEVGSIIGSSGSSHVPEPMTIERKIISFDLCGCDVVRRKKHHPSCSIGSGVAQPQIAQPDQTVAELPVAATPTKQKPHKGQNPNQLPMFGGTK
jgi:hypothetical protein